MRRSGERDVDLVIFRDTVEVIGEAKAMEVSPDVRSAAANFHDQINTVYKQLTKRLTAFDAGEPLVDGCKQRHRVARNVIGLGVVLHPFSNALGDPRCSRS